MHYPGDHQALAAVLPLVADELNVKEVVFAESDASFGRWRAKPNYKVLGPRLGDLVKRVAAALAADDGAVASSLARGETVTLSVAMDRRSNSGPTTWTWVRRSPKGGASRRTAASRSRSTSRSTDELRRRGRRARSCAPCRTRAGPRVWM